MKTMSWLLAILLVLVLAGCTVNVIEPLTNSYKGKSPREIASDKSYILDGAPPQVKEGVELKSDLLDIIRRGYEYVGSANYLGSKLSSGSLQKFGALYHAGYVVNYVEYMGSVSNTIPGPSSTGSSSYRAGSGAGYSLMQSLVFAARGTHTKYYSNVVGLFVKRKQGRMGFYISDVQNQAGVKQRGAWVDIVQYNSIASTSGLKEGDVILRVDETNLYDADHLTDIVSELSLGVHNLSVHRDGSVIVIPVKLD
ncbi:MAG TPA: PDZ domain-containing protein [Candidatus Cloacimonadota bacterium]|nr:PDZ domain-containing protein [Candidatus Cloacimonadota bacterium]